MAFVDPGRGRGPADRLGLAVQLCTLPWLGFVPDEVSSAPPVAVARLAERLGLDPGVPEGYGRRSHTRSDHLLLVAKYLGWKSAPAGGGEMKEVEQFLLDRAMEHDSPALLFNLATEFRFLATVGRRSTVQALMRREERRYPILLALVAQSAADQLDEVIALFDQAVSARESRARTRTD